MFQPREGFCGMSTFNSALRSIPARRVDGSVSGAENGIFVKLHGLPRYVTLQQAESFFNTVICGSGRPSAWDEAGGGAVKRVEAVPGGSYDEFMRCVRMLNDPECKVRICAMYA